jgi:hypothetical protein
MDGIVNWRQMRMRMKEIRKIVLDSLSDLKENASYKKLELALDIVMCIVESFPNVSKEQYELLPMLAKYFEAFIEAVNKGKMDEIDRLMQELANLTLDEK